MELLFLLTHGRKSAGHVCHFSHILRVQPDPAPSSSPQVLAALHGKPSPRFASKGG